jgi:hypothetical protein
MFSDSFDYFFTAYALPELEVSLPIYSINENKEIKREQKK